MKIFSVDKTKQLIIFSQSLQFKVYRFIRYYTARNYPKRGIPPLSPKPAKNKKKDNISLDYKYSSILQKYRKHSPSAVP